MKVTQEDGSLVFDAPAKIQPQCNMGPTSRFMLRQIKTVEFALSVSPETAMDHPGLAFMLAGQEEADTSIYMICGVSGDNLVMNNDQENVCHTARFRESREPVTYSGSSLTRIAWFSVRCQAKRSENSPCCRLMSALSDLLSVTYGVVG
jgi:hypothetical protein